jgi:hypothetical protein
MTKRRAMAKEVRLEIVEEDGGLVMYCVEDGKRIAKRYPQKPWINLEPGYTVRRVASNPEAVEITYNSADAEPQ